MKENENYQLHCSAQKQNWEYLLFDYSGVKFTQLHTRGPVPFGWPDNDYHHLPDSQLEGNQDWAEHKGTFGGNPYDPTPK